MAALYRLKGRLMTFPFVRMAAMAFAAAAIMGDDAALAQATKPAAPAPGQAAAAGPVKLELVGLQPQWTKQCSKDQGGKEVCLTQREFGQVVDQPPTLIIAVYQIGDEHRFARFVLPLGFLLSPGFRLLPEKGEPIPGRFAFCLPQGCFAEAELGNAGINALKKSGTASVVVRNQANTEVTFSFPMRDFGPAYDGPPMDPKVIEQQNQELQRQLEEKARQQREQLEKQSGAQPTPAPTPPK
jgi:invasion protein IalB